MEGILAVEQPGGRNNASSAFDVENARHAEWQFVTGLGIFLFVQLGLELVGGR